MLTWLLAVAWAASPIDELRRDAATAGARGDPTGTADGYRFMGQALGGLADDARARPGALSVERFGESLEGRGLWAFHVEEPGVPIDDEVLIIAGLHALEWIGSESALDLLDDLIARPRRGTRVTVVPFLNPDGRAAVEADLRSGLTDRYRRGNAARVDLNRDFAENREARAVWRHVIPGRFGTSPAPLSQPESRALDALCAGRDYTRAASAHAFGGYLYHPWSGRWEHPDDWSVFVETGRSMERAQGAGAYRTRQLSRWGFFFRAHGSEIDHLYARHGIQAWLFEISRSGLSRPSDRRVPFRWYNPRDPAPHLRRTVAAFSALIDGPMTASERHLHEVDRSGGKPP